jgi:hypothetical protein
LAGLLFEGKHLICAEASGLGDALNFLFDQRSKFCGRLGWIKWGFNLPRSLLGVFMLQICVGLL